METALCRCGRVLRLLNRHAYYGPSSSEVKCVGCGYVSDLCRCAPGTPEDDRDPRRE